MSAVPDPTDAKADGNFGGNHRGGYSPDRLARAEAWARRGYTLAAGEGAVLVQELERLREELAAARAVFQPDGPVPVGSGDPHP